MLPVALGPGSINTFTLYPEYTCSVLTSPADASASGAEHLDHGAREGVHL